MSFKINYKGMAINVSHEEAEPSEVAAKVLEKIGDVGEDEGNRILYHIYKSFGHEVKYWPRREQEIERLKGELQSTDYIALKAFEGHDCSQYGDWKSARQEIRDEINRIEGMTDEQWDAQYTEYDDIQ